ncbi:hypothetical protein HDV00_007954 [Rhizophlyctis rosea]|nr:hypothetical protein HDV00_007954 [Rhizophlyctis rosea]
MAGVPIPQPPEKAIVGNLFEIDPDYGLGSLQRLATLYGPIYRLTILGNKLVIISSQELVNEACNEKNFAKDLSRPLVEIRHLAGDGLFTAYNDEPNWKLAHKILIPAFGPANIRAMFPDMYDIASQLVLKWERFGSEYDIDVPHDFTRLTLDTIALCSFSYRFNSFYNDAMHPFVQGMVDVLLESGHRTRRLPIQQSLMVRTQRKFENDIGYLHELCDKIVKERQDHPTDTKDLLNLMLNGRDKETGQGLTTENIRYQMVTFLIAGHETTSGLLSFAFYHLLKNPSTLQKAQTEVDTVTKGNPITVENLKDLKYIDAILKETLRLNPTAPLFTVKTKDPYGYTFGTGHTVQADEVVGVLLPSLHKDPKVWGDDAEVFRPERMLDGGFEGLPPNAWKPFGNGMRACIGRPFAWQESLLVVAMILQRFNLELADSSYNLKIKQTLTIKPDGFKMRVHVRKGSHSPAAIPSTLGHSPVTTAHKHAVVAAPAQTEVVADSANKFKITVLFGSNSGSCETFADRIATDASEHAITAKVATLDSATESLSTDQPVIIVCPSYEGQPADNSKRFFSWLTSLTDSNALKGVTYAVFGAGHHDWATTYQRVPTVIDEKMQALGATRILERGVADAAGDFFGDFEAWEDRLWVALKSVLKITDDQVEDSKLAQRGRSLQDVDVTAATGGGVTGAGSSGGPLDVEILNEQRTAALGHKDFGFGVIVENKALTPEFMKCGSLQKRHVEIKLPEGITYRAGDYLAIMPINPIKDIKRVLSRFKLPVDASVVIKTNTKTFLPTNRPIPVHTLLGGYVELAQPASRRHIDTLVQLASERDKAAMEALTNPETYTAEILEKRVSLLDLLELHPNLPLPFSHFLSLLPPMRMRQYSISSSPLWNPNHVTLTFDVLVAPSLSGHATKVGVASNFLAHSEPGDHIACVVRPSAAPFHLPSDPSTPIIMVAAGSGMSPMRGFIQERSAMVACGRECGKAILYYGCRDSEEDYIYQNELKKWEALGAVEVRPTFSKHSAPPNSATSSTPDSSTTPPKYVYERIYEDREELSSLLKEGQARVYICGSNKLARSVGNTCVKIYMERHEGAKEEEAREWYERMKGERFATDVFG